MRKKTLILLACLGLLVPLQGRADVSFVSFRIGEDGTIRDIQTSLTSDTMASMVPIVEPDGSLTTPEEEEERKTSELFFLAEEDDSTEQEVESQEETEDNTQEESTNTDESSGVIRHMELTPMFPAAADDPETTCETVHGVWTSYGGESYCCNSDGKLYELGGWTTNFVMPQCGCHGENVYRSIKVDNNNLWVCCRGHNLVESSTTGAEGVISDKGDNALCYCPVTVNNQAVNEIEALSFSNGQPDLYCCAGNKRVQSATVISPNDDAYCKCFNSNICDNQTACEAVGHYWCNGACSAEETCTECPQGEGYEVKTVGGRNICCKNGSSYSKQGDEWFPYWDPASCGCPPGGTLDEEENICCDNQHHIWGGTSYNVVDARCGCPDGYEIKSNDYDDIKVCCSQDPAQKGTYLGMDDDKTSDVSRAIRACGCRADELGPRAGDGENSFVCCKNNQITHYTTDVSTLIGQDSRYCGCATGIYDRTSGECVSCLSDSDCTAQGTGKRCLIDEEDPTHNTCVECKYSSDCSECPTEGSSSAKVCDTILHVCKTCSDMSGSAGPYRWRGNYGQDTSSCNSCYECTQDSHCAGRTDGKTVCDPNTLTCQVCVLNDAEKEANKGCNSRTQTYCIIGNAGNRLCSECRNNDDCLAHAGTRKICQVGAGICSEDCGDYGYNRMTGECNCSGATPVFDIYRKKCVTCYDSISGNWTDLGCNQEWNKDTAYTGSAGNYSPFQSAQTAGKPVCWVKNANDLGTCVECLKDVDCPGEKLCTNQACDCPSDKRYYDPATGQCLVCGANYGASSGSNKCPKLKPLCKDGDCTCKNNYDSSKKDGDGKCPQLSPVCKNGSCTCTADYEKDKAGTCPQSKPICNATSHECEACPAGTTNKDGVCECENGTWSSATKVCTCKEGYGVAEGTKKCVDAKLPADKKCKNAKRPIPKTGAGCFTNMFVFTTVNKIKYKVTFPDEAIDTDDYVLFVRGVDENIDPGRGNSLEDHSAVKKKFCRNGSEALTSSQTCGHDAAGTLISKADNFTFVGDGKNAFLRIVNSINPDDYYTCADYACGDSSSNVVFAKVTVDSSSGSYETK